MLVGNPPIWPGIVIDDRDAVLTGRGTEGTGLRGYADGRTATPPRNSSADSPFTDEAT